MATKKTTPIGEVLEVTIVVNPRGRSVVNGTIVDAGGKFHTVKKELDDAAKSRVTSLVLDLVDYSYPSLP
jgi:hypothetical protein